MRKHECTRCGVYLHTCYCSAIPQNPLPISSLSATQLVLWRLPCETNEAFRTAHLAPLIFDSVHVHTASSVPRIPSRNIALLCPYEPSITADQWVTQSFTDEWTVVIFDSTWRRARQMYNKFMSTYVSRNELVPRIQNITLPALSQFAAWAISRPPVRSPLSHQIELLLFNQQSEAEYDIEDLSKITSRPGGWLRKLRAPVKLAPNKQLVSTLEAVAVLIETLFWGRFKDFQLDFQVVSGLAAVYERRINTVVKNVKKRSSEGIPRNVPLLDTEDLIDLEAFPPDGMSQESTSGNSQESTSGNSQESTSGNSQESTSGNSQENMSQKGSLPTDGISLTAISNIQKQLLAISSMIATGVLQALVFSQLARRNKSI